MTIDSSRRFNVLFTNVKWPPNSKRNKNFKLAIRGEFLESFVGDDLSVTGYSEGKDILIAYLTDEFNETPLDIEFAVNSEMT